MAAFAAIRASHEVKFLSMGRYMLSQHPEVERRVAEELDALGLLAKPGRPRPRPAEFADIARLTYLKCIIKVGLLDDPA